MRIAFYAPMKPPDHPVPSGDRRMARLLLAALAQAGHQVEVASRFRSYDGAGRPERQAALRAEGDATAAALLEGYRSAGKPRPELWFTYHLYHKAPDWLGPPVARALSIPYVVAEASFAPKRAGGPWDLGHRAATQQIGEADAVLCMTRLDMECVAPLVQPPARLYHLPPFIDAEAIAATGACRPACRRALSAAHGIDVEAPWLIAVGMMRSGDKLESYGRLGAALMRLVGREWRLLVVGDGPARVAVEAALAAVRERTVFLGQLAPEQLAQTLAAADLYVWPAAGEAYGMALLEAQAAGLPVVAGRERGVPDLVRDGETGLLCPPGDAAAFATAVMRLIDDGTLRRRLGRSAQDLTLTERGLVAAARRLDEIIRGLPA